MDENKINLIFENLDFLIFNYRKSLLDSFISLEKARATGEWFLTNNNDRNDLKINWDVKRWDKYLSHSIDSLSLMLNVYNKFERNKYMICYENFYKNKLRFNYLSNIFKDQISICEKIIGFKKQRKDTLLKDNFINSLDFLDYCRHNKSLMKLAKDISIYIRYKNDKNISLCFNDFILKNKFL